MAEFFIPYKPFPIHLPAHLSIAREKALLGSVGSGKTLALCGQAISWANQVPGRRLMISRSTVPSLRDTTESELIDMLSTPPEEDDEDEVAMTLWELIEREHLLKRSGGHVDHFYFPNGSQVLFRSLDNWTKIMSYNLSWIGVDEANEIDFNTYVNLTSRLRQKQPTGMARRKGVKWGVREKNVQEIMLASNSHGHNWIWEQFVNSPTPDRRWFRSTSFDNPTLYNEDGTLSHYLTNLLSMPPIWVKRFVMCEFDAFEGQILDFDPRESVYSHFEPPADWERGMGLDWGLRNPTACVWFAREPGTQKWYIYREWQSYDSTIPEQREMHATPSVASVAAMIKRLEGDEVIRWRAADPMIWRRQTVASGDTRSIEYWFRQHKLFFTAGAKDYETRINSLNQPLSARMLQVSNHCPQTQIAFQQYRWEDLKIEDRDPKEQPVKKNDHLVDAAEYFLSLFTTSKVPDDANRPLTFDDEIRRNVRNQVKKYATMRKR